MWRFLIGQILTTLKFEQANFPNMWQVVTGLIIIIFSRGTILLVIEILHLTAVSMQSLPLPML